MFVTLHADYARDDVNGIVNQLLCCRRDSPSAQLSSVSDYLLVNIVQGRRDCMLFPAAGFLAAVSRRNPSFTLADGQLGPIVGHNSP
jgi:hypothetical protein